MNINLNEFVKQLYQQANEKDLLISIGIENFLTYSKLNKRPGTYRYYKEMFKGIIEYFDAMNINYFSQLTNEVIVNYMNYLHKINNKPVTINKKITGIKTLLNYLEDIEMINHIEIKIKKLKEIKPKIQTVDLETLQLVINHLRDHHSKQHQLIFELMLQTGVRRTELLNIERHNINLEENTIYLERTKSGNSRNLYFDNLIKELIEYEIKSKPNNKFLFITHEGKQLTTSAIDSMFNRIKKELSILTLSPHLLRHTFGTILMEETKDIETVRILLGHTSYEMTKRYLHLKESTTKENSLKGNPLTKIKRECRTL